MSKKYRTTTSLHCPATESDDRAVRKAGGLRKMTQGQRAKVAYKHVEADAPIGAKSIPSKCLETYLETGAIVEVQSSEEE